MSRHSSLMLEGFIVAIENNYQGRTRVVIEFFYVAQLYNIYFGSIQFNIVFHSQEPPQVLIWILTLVSSKLVLLNHGDECRLQLKIVCFYDRLPDCRVIIPYDRSPEVLHRSLPLRSFCYCNWFILISLFLLCHN